MPARFRPGAFNGVSSRALRYVVAPLTLVLLGGAPSPGPSALTVGVSVTPVNGTDPTPRAANSTGNTVSFTVTNTGNQDTRYSGTCTVTGKVTSVSCTSIGSVMIPGEQRTVTATFAVGTAGAGTVNLAVVSTLPTGASGSGKWNITVVNASGTVTPDGQAVSVAPNTAATQVFTVTNTGSASTTMALSAACTGTGLAAGCSVNPTSVTLAPQQAGTTTLSYMTTAAGTGTATVTASSGVQTLDNGSINVTVLGPAAAVTPDGQAVTDPPSTASSQVFTVTNTRQSSTTYTLSGSCSGSGGGVTGCAVSGSTTLTLNVGASGNGTVTFTTQGTGTTGVVALRASVGGVVLDSGYVNVTVLLSQHPPTVDVASVNPGAVLARGQCTTIAIGSAAASECEDLRIVHPLPAVRAMNKARAPTLIYSSAQAMPFPTVAANVTLPAGSNVPTTVTAALKVLSVTRASGSWSGGQWSAGTTRRLVVGFDSHAAGLASGIYDYQLDVTNVYSGSSLTTSATGKLVIVDRTTSSFGAGWWLAGLEQLNVGTMVWTGGDGSVRQYTLLPGSVAPNRVWGAPSMTYPDSIREIPTGGYLRQLPDSVWVTFDTQGRHVQTRNRQGHVTVFAYDGSGRLQTITLPPSTAPLTYTFAYDGSNHLQTVTAPGATASRTVTITADPATGRITLITEPEARTVGFGYGSDNRITSRTDRRGTVMSYQYDAASKVSRSSLAVPSIVRTLTNAAALGLSPTSADPTAVRTRLDGPRSVNTTSFYLNKYGSPTLIVNATSGNTTLARSNATYPGLVTQFTTPGGHTVTAVYDSRGRLQTSSQPAASGTTATTSYTWDPKWDQLTHITNPDNSVMDFGVDPATGNRLWQQDGRGTVSQTSFDYNAANQLAAVYPPNTRTMDIWYDTRGNLASTDFSRCFCPTERVTTWTNNAIGLPTQVTYPSGDVQTLTYSVRNEELTNSTTGGGQTAATSKGYDNEGNLLSVTRSATGISNQVTSWIYDPANRATRQNEPDGTFEVRGYDEAGDLTSVTTRRNLAVTMAYDALNRLASRTYAAVSYSLPASQIYPATLLIPYTYSDAGDTDTLVYDADGRITSAVNKNASVSRSYHSSGALLSETLGIKSRDRATTHSYTTSYGYDVMNRRISMTAPALFSGVPTTYGYDPQGGELTSVHDIAGNSFGMTYSGENQLLSISYPGSFTETLGYDGYSRLISDGISGPANSTFPHYPSTILRSLSITSYNTRDQILSSSDPSSYNADQVQATYSGLGHLANSQLHQLLSNAVTGGTGTFDSNDDDTYDGLGNILGGTERWGVNIVNGQFTNISGFSNTYDGSLRLTQRTSGSGGTTTYSYDASGNETFNARVAPGQNQGTSEERASYYSGHDKLLAADHRLLALRTLEEYRYDALGRRVWVRRWTECAPLNTIECITSATRRTIWDGNQELAEIQAPSDSTNPALEELDTGWPVQPYNPGAGDYGDPNPFFGRVVYGPSVGVDQPLSVTRYEYRDYPNGASTLTWPQFTLMIFWDYRGAPVYGLYTDGTWARPYQLANGQTNCPIVGGTTTQRCALLQWPFHQSAYDQNRGNVAYPSWQGTLLQNKRDASGLEYKRNRVYDPTTGRFTQEDPSGLAGGLNAYGFTSGDPVNFSDPFGLCRQPGDPDCNPIERGIAAFNAAVGSVADRLSGGLLKIRDALAGRQPGSSAAAVVNNLPDPGSVDYSVTLHGPGLSVSVGTDGVHGSISGELAVAVTADATYTAPGPHSGAELSIGGSSGEGLVGGASVNTAGGRVIGGTVSAGVGVDLPLPKATPAVVRGIAAVLGSIAVKAY